MVQKIFDKTKFGTRLKELRTDKGLSSTQLAKIIDVSPSIIIRWENNNRTATIDNLYKVAKFFGVSADYLIGLED